MPRADTYQVGDRVYTWRHLDLVGLIEGTITKVISGRRPMYLVQIIRTSTGRDIQSYYNRQPLKEISVRQSSLHRVRKVAINRIRARIRARVKSLDKRLEEQTRLKNRLQEISKTVESLL